MPEIRTPLRGREFAIGLGFPEGPVAMPDGSLLVVEIEGGRLTRIRPDGSIEVVAELGGGPNGAAVGPDGMCYVCNNGGLDWKRDRHGRLRPSGRVKRSEGGRIERVDLRTGAFEVLYKECNGIPLKGPNDIVFDRNGGFWFTDFGKVYDRTMDRGAIYYARTDGSLIKEAIFPFLTPNGIGISPEGATLYVSETESSRLWSYQIVGEGVVSREPWPSPNGGRLAGSFPGYQRFDSLKVEAGGNICVATLVDAGVSVFSPDGELLEFHTAADPYCTNLAFGGLDLRTAYITLSGFGTVLEVQWPRPGLPLLHQRG